MKRRIYEAEHEALRETTRQYIEREIAPNAEQWEAERLVDRSAYVAAGKYGLIGFNMPEEFGGGGSEDFRFNAVIQEEFARAMGVSREPVRQAFALLQAEGLVVQRAGRGVIVVPLTVAMFHEPS